MARRTAAVPEAGAIIEVGDDQACAKGKRAAIAYVASLPSPHSQRTMSSSLRTLTVKLLGREVEDLAIPWHLVDLEPISVLRSRLAQGEKPATANRLLCGLRGTLKYAWLLGFMSAEMYHRRAEAARSVRGSSLPAGRDITTGELTALMNACGNDDSALGARDAAIIAILGGCGLRRAELAALDLSDYDAGDGALRIHGKGNKQRIAFVVGGGGRCFGRLVGSPRTGAGPVVLAGATWGAPPTR